MVRILAGAGFLACILAANYATTEYGMVTVLGVTATAGTVYAGMAFVLRDAVQDTAGKPSVVALIIAGAALSYIVAEPRIAVASGAAFLASETADLLIYTPLRRRGYVRAAVASNVAGAAVDTVLFLWIAGYPVAESFAGQMAGKLAATLAVVLAVGGVRALSRQPVRT